MNYIHLRKVFLIALLMLFFVKQTNGQLIGSFGNKYDRFEKGQKFENQRTTEWNAVAWRGEELYQQLVLWSEHADYELTYQISMLKAKKGEMKCNAVQLNFSEYVKGDEKPKDCGAYSIRTSNPLLTDALSEETEDMFKLTSEDPKKIWVKVKIPYDAKPGVYLGNIIVKDKKKNKKLTFDLTFQVLDYTLPKPHALNFELDLWQFPKTLLDNIKNTQDVAIKLWSKEHIDLLMPGYQKLFNYGQKSITVYIKEGAMGAPSMIKWIRNRDNSWSFNYTDFDRYVSSMLANHPYLSIKCFSPLGWPGTGINFLDKKTGTMGTLKEALHSTKFSDVMVLFLEDFKKHLKKKNWFDKAILYLDESHSEELNSVIKIVRKSDKKWKIGIANTFQLDAYQEKELYEAAEFLGRTRHENTNGMVKLFYTSCSHTIPNNYISKQSDLAEMAWMPLFASANKLQGYTRWAYDYWRNNDLLNAQDGSHTAGDFSMIYRGPKNNIHQLRMSLRLAMLFQGIQMFEKIEWLRNNYSKPSATNIQKAYLDKIERALSQMNKDHKIRTQVVRLEKLLSEMAQLN